MPNILKTHATDAAPPLRILTGIKPSGTPHIGNYVGAIRPALTTGRAPDVENFYFLADLHSLINTTDPVRVQQSTLKIAATWLAAGLDPANTWFYRQSDVPEIAELNWLLACVASKGMLNRAHAYKAAADTNDARGDEKDAGISAGLFTYPVLMAADILIFQANKVPVGRDQVQHIEMARDIAQRFAHVYGQGYFSLPEAVIDHNVSTLPGLDGRKMSKSYDNTIPLFASRSELKKLVFSMQTNSQLPGEPKQTEGNALFDMYRAFAGPEEVATFAQAFAEGIGWGDAKQHLLERVERELAPLRDQYQYWMSRPSEIEAILRNNATRLRERYARPQLARVREAVGLRSLSSAAVASPKKEVTASTASFKQYRDTDGLFYFKLLGHKGQLVLQSSGYPTPNDIAAAIQSVKAASCVAELDSIGILLNAGPDMVLDTVRTLRERA